MLTGKAEQRLERGHWRASSVESECELVEVVGQVFAPHAMMGAGEPCLEVGEDPVYSRQEFGDEVAKTRLVRAKPGLKLGHRLGKGGRGMSFYLRAQTYYILCHGEPTG